MKPQTNAAVERRLDALDEALAAAYGDEQAGTLRGLLENAEEALSELYPEPEA
jgi:hypothetical protein